VRLDRDAALALEVHRIEDLRFHLSSLERAGQLEKSVSEGRLAVIDVGNDREIAYQPGIQEVPLWGQTPFFRNS
jgi:hypothetical protein